jgi:hypothetical protein
MGSVVCVVQGEYAELRFDQVQPRGRGRRPDRMNPESPKECKDSRMVVDVLEVVEDHEEPFAAVTAAPGGRTHRRSDAFALAEEAVEAVGMDVIEAEELLGALGTPVRRAHPTRPRALRPGDPAHRAQFERAPLVEAHYRAARRA